MKIATTTISFSQDEIEELIRQKVQDAVTDKIDAPYSDRIGVQFNHTDAGVEAIASFDTELPE
ncbi:MAG: hypothetical protein AB7F22_07745 [Reyranella sp.]|uniref:hypothetical protein n=1 Tax=Reyranella sp. TaxID=1929291 RepID=UPI003D0CED5F